MVANFTLLYLLITTQGSPSGIVANVLDSDTVVIKFEFQSCYCIHFQTNSLGKGMNSLISLAMDQIVLLLFFYMIGFGIK